MAMFDRVYWVLKLLVKIMKKKNKSRMPTVSQIKKKPALSKSPPLK